MDSYDGKWNSTHAAANSGEPRRYVCRAALDFDDAVPDFCGWMMMGTFLDVLVCHEVANFYDSTWG